MLSSDQALTILDRNGIQVPKKKIGRPHKITSEVVQKLEDAYLNQATDVQAAFIAGISLRALYDYQERHPEFRLRKEALKSNIAYQAKKSIQKHIPRDGKLALDVIERLEKNEWSLRTELTGNNGEPLSFTFVPPS